MGSTDWAVISKHMQTSRSPKQCRERWCYILKPGLKKGDWTNEEDDAIIMMHKDIGNQWAVMSRKLEGRTDIDVKNRFNSLQRTRRNKTQKRVLVQNDDQVNSGTIFQFESKKIKPDIQVNQYFLDSKRTLLSDSLNQNNSKSLQSQMKNPSVESSKIIQRQFGFSAPKILSTELTIPFPGGSGSMLTVPLGGYHYSCRQQERMHYDYAQYSNLHFENQYYGADEYWYTIYFLTIVS